MCTLHKVALNPPNTKIHATLCKQNKKMHPKIIAKVLTCGRISDIINSIILELIEAMVKLRLFGEQHL